jgi:hypothetical protein
MAAESYGGPARRFAAVAARSMAVLAAASAVVLLLPSAGAGQETALKGSLSLSRLQAEGANTSLTDRLLATGFGGHMRFRFGAIALQPEVMVVTRGAEVPTARLQEGLQMEQIRLEYVEIPLLIAVPVQVGRFEPYIMAGGMVALETRCRHVIREDDLRTNLSCDAQQSELPDRRALDWGVAAGGGVSYPIWGGRVLAEARQTWGLRNISDQAPLELRNRTLLLTLGYVLTGQAPRQ